MTTLRIILIFSLFGFLGQSFGLAQTNKATVKPYVPGGVVQDFCLNNLRNGHPVSLYDFIGYKCVVLVFTSPYCSFDEFKKNNIAEAFDKYAGETVKFISICPVSIEPDSLASMQAPWHTIVLNDQGLEVCLTYGIKKTPTVCVLENLLGRFVLKYQGNVTHIKNLEINYLMQALEALTAGEQVDLPYVKPVGCQIVQE
jgi:peroxiredoxin